MIDGFKKKRLQIQQATHRMWVYKLFDNILLSIIIAQYKMNFPVYTNTLKFLQFDWLRAVVFQLTMKYLHEKITNLLRVVPYSPLFSRDLNFAKIFSAHFASL